MKYKLKEDKDQKVFDDRLKNNEMRVIYHKMDDASAYCRICSFSMDNIDGKDAYIITKAKEHARKTGHTVDIYREHWTEITYYNKNK